MDNQANTVKQNKSSAMLAAMTLLSGLITAILFQTGILIIPFTAGLLASLFLRESCKKRRLTYIISAVLIVFDLVFNGIFSFNCLASVIAAVIIYLCFVKWRGKSECAVYLTVLITAFTVFSFVLVGFLTVREFSISLVRDFYANQIELLEVEFIKAFSALAFQNQDGQVQYVFTESDLKYLFDSMLKSLPSCFAVLSFALSGVALKLFTHYGVKRSPFTERLSGYSFKTTNLFVYFYLVLIIVSVFLGNPESTLEIAFANLNTVFMFVYAYLGYKYVSEIIAHKTGKPRLSAFLVIVIVLFFSSFAIQLLSYIGVFFTIIRNKAEKIMNGGYDD